MARKKAVYQEEVPEFTLEERVEMLENGIKSLLAKLHTHGIRLDAAAEPEPEEETED